MKCKALREGADHDGLGRGAKERGGWRTKPKGTRWQGGDLLVHQPGPSRVRSWAGSPRVVTLLGYQSGPGGWSSGRKLPQQSWRPWEAESSVVNADVAVRGPWSAGRAHTPKSRELGLGVPTGWATRTGRESGPRNSARSRGRGAFKPITAARRRDQWARGRETHQQRSCWRLAEKPPTRRMGAGQGATSGWEALVRGSCSSERAAATVSCGVELRRKVSPVVLGGSPRTLILPVGLVPHAGRVFLIPASVCAGGPETALGLRPADLGSRAPRPPGHRFVSGFVRPCSPPRLPPLTVPGARGSLLFVS